MEKYLAQLLNTPGGAIEDPTGLVREGTGTLSSAITVGLQLFLIVVIVAALLYIAWAGLRWIQSSGDPQKIEEARKQIIFAIIGLVIALLSFGLVTFFGTLFRINLT